LRLMPAPNERESDLEELVSRHEVERGSKCEHRWKPWTRLTATKRHRWCPDCLHYQIKHTNRVIRRRRT